MKLTPKQLAFCEMLISDKYLNATQAYMAVYKVKSEKVAKAAAARALANVNIQKKVQELKDARSARTNITQDFVLKQLAAIAGANITDFLQIKTTNAVDQKDRGPAYDYDDEDNDDKPLPAAIGYKEVEVFDTDNMPKDKIAAISVIKPTKFGIEIRLSDKVRALELLARHLGMLNDNVNLTGSIDFATFLKKPPKNNGS